MRAKAPKWLDAATLRWVAEQIDESMGDAEDVKVACEDDAACWRLEDNHER